LIYKVKSAHRNQNAVGAAAFAPFGKQFEAELVSGVQVEGVTCALESSVIAMEHVGATASAVTLSPTANVRGTFRNGIMVCADTLEMNIQADTRIYESLVLIAYSMIEVFSCLLELSIIISGVKLHIYLYL
jgi:hypothetical protein